MPASQRQIIDALGKLDPEADAHWTQTGLPRLEVLQQSAGDPELSRSDVNAAAPDFNRENLQLPPPEAEEPAPPIESDERADIAKQVRTEIRQRMSDCEVKAQELLTEITELQTERDEQLRERDRLLTEYDSRFPKLSHGEQMRNWLDKTNQHRMDEALRLRAVRAALGDDAPVASTLDRAMAGKVNPFNKRRDQPVQ